MGKRNLLIFSSEFPPARSNERDSDYALLSLALRLLPLCSQFPLRALSDSRNPIAAIQFLVCCSWKSELIAYAIVDIWLPHPLIYKQQQKLILRELQKCDFSICASARP